MRIDGREETHAVLDAALRAHDDDVRCSMMASFRCTHTYCSKRTASLLLLELARGIEPLEERHTTVLPQRLPHPPLCLLPEGVGALERALSRVGEPEEADPLVLPRGAGDQPCTLERLE